MYVCRLLRRRNPDDTRGEVATLFALAPTACVPVAYFVFVEVVTSANSNNTCTLPLRLCQRTWAYGDVPIGPSSFCRHISANDSLYVLGWLFMISRKMHLNTSLLMSVSSIFLRISVTNFQETYMTYQTLKIQKKTVIFLAYFGIWPKIVLKNKNSIFCSLS